jgi:uncharacterized protein (TIGR02001 family)
MAATLFAGGMLATPAMAQDTEVPSEIEVSGNAAIVTDYRFRGVSLSAGDPAIQGGIDIAHSSGFYIGTWGSSIEGGALYGEMELDIYGGWSGDLTSGLSTDIGVIYYAYPANDFGPADYVEVYGSLGTQLGPVGASVGVAYAPDQDSLGGEDNLYISLDLEAGVPNTPIALTAHAGYTDGVLAPDLLAGGIEDDGWDYSVGASVTVLGGLGLGVQYIATDGTEVDDLTDDAVVGTLSYSF